METDSARLLIKSYGTWTYIKHGVMKNYHPEERQLVISGYLE